MHLKVLVQNTDRGALCNSEGSPQDRWPLLAERIGAVRPDIVLAQELVGWADHGHRQLVRAQDDLDMDALLAPSRSGFHTGVLYRRETLGRYAYWNTDYAETETHHGLGTAGFTIPGLPGPLTFTSVHLTPYSALKAVAEADFAASRAYRRGPYAVLAGDVNHPPPAGPEPDYPRMTPATRGARTVHTDPALGLPPRPNRAVAWALYAHGLRDAAWELHRRTGDDALLRPTAPEDRVDQCWVSAPLVPALTGYTVLDAPEGASDHHGLLVGLDTGLIGTGTA